LKSGSIRFFNSILITYLCASSFNYTYQERQRDTPVEVLPTLTEMLSVKCYFIYHLKFHKEGGKSFRFKPEKISQSNMNLI